MTSQLQLSYIYWELRNKRQQYFITDEVENIRDKSIASIKDNKSVFNNANKNSVNKEILLKTERLVSAVHLVTSLMDKKESLRDQLRDTSLLSINDLYDVPEKIGDRISHILSLLEIGRTGGLISEMNYRILREEYVKLANVLTKLNLADPLDNYVLPREFFGRDIGAPGRAPSYLSDTKKTSFIKKDKVGGLNSNDSLGDKAIATKDTRKEAILRVIKDGSEYTIKDIILEISVIAPAVDCSNKTIQRDLLALVAEGVLVRTGERRWSRYAKKPVS